MLKSEALKSSLVGLYTIESGGSCVSSKAIKSDTVLKCDDSL